MDPLGVKPEKMKRTRKTSPNKIGLPVRRKTPVDPKAKNKLSDELPRLRLRSQAEGCIETKSENNVTDISETSKRTVSLPWKNIKITNFYGDHFFGIYNWTDLESWRDARSWRSGDVMIRNEDGQQLSISWKGTKTDLDFSSVCTIDWEHLKEIAEISAQDTFSEKPKPFEEIQGQDIKAPEKDEKPCVICRDNLSQCANTACGHKIFCINCANEFTKGKENACPCCRTRIERLIRIF